MKPMLLTFLLLGLTLAWGQTPQANGPQGGNTQMSDQTNAYPAQNNTPGSRMGSQSLSQSTVEGCLMGNGNHFILTDEHEGAIYLLSGNDALLKGHVGQQVAITGVASNIEPSNQPGQPGYINPSQPDKEGAAGTRVGSKSKNFEVQYVQQEAAQCHSASASQANAIAASNATLGSVANSNSGAAPQVGYTAGGSNGLQGRLSGGPGNSQSSQSPQATAGKTGNTGDQVPVSSTASAGSVTPGAQTQAGEAQNPQDKAARNAAGANPAQNNTEKNGAPTPNQQIGEDRAAAERSAAAAHRAEVGGYQSGNYGVNGNAPDYSKAKGQPPATQSAQNNSPGSAEPNTQNQKGQGSEGGMAANRDQKPNRTTLTGCLEGTKNGHEFTLRTEDGHRISLQSTREDLKDHLNHTVQIIGKQGGSSPQHKAVAGHNGEQRFTVNGINDLAPSCGEGGK